MLRVRGHLRQAPKSGLAPSSTEDAAAPRSSPFDQSCGEVRLAVADGASASADSGWWAQQLVQDLCAAPGRAFWDPQAFARVTTRASLRWPARRRKWLEEVGRSDTVRWLLHDRMVKGPSATALGILLWDGLEPPALEHESPDGSSGPPLPHPGEPTGPWYAVSVGDSCLFHVRGGELLATVPALPQSLRRRPDLVSAAPGEEGPRQASTHHGTWAAGDVFYLVTDALARWCLRRLPGERPWPVLDELCGADPSAFTEWVRVEREGRRLQDDDITVLRAECLPC
ncbi:hypothetical protein ACFXOS_24595 [Streptomyces sp. NPDC059175]|uniref:hypothetical protein n=1 Tax=Streptomyces sp. NPDC059175 TaxID=3346757 RepID=UPI00367CBFD4